MFEAKKLIPPLAVASLALTGCGDSDSSVAVVGTGGSGGADGNGALIEQAIADFCMKEVECYQAGDVQDCVRDQREYAEGISDRCLALRASYLNCVSDLCYRDFDGDGYAIEACIDEVADEFGRDEQAYCYG